VAEVSEVNLPEVMAEDEIDGFAVTVPLIAGSEPMVTELPTVTEEMLMGTVPLIDAVTVPICAVPAPIVTVPAPIVTTPIRFVPAGRAEPMVTVPEMGKTPSASIKLTMPFCTANSKSLPAFAVTVPEMAGRELIVRLFPTVTVPPTVTALARSWVLVRLAEVALTISVIACVPRLTTVWAVMCCPLERMVESVVADWLPSKIESAI